MFFIQNNDLLTFVINYHQQFVKIDKNTDVTKVKNSNKEREQHYFSFQKKKENEIKPASHTDNHGQADSLEPFQNSNTFECGQNALLGSVHIERTV